MCWKRRQPGKEILVLPVWASGPQPAPELSLEADRSKWEVVVVCCVSERAQIEHETEDFSFSCK